MHVPEGIGVNIVVGRPIGIYPDDLRLDFKIRLTDVRAAYKSHPTGNPALFHKR